MSPLTSHYNGSASMATDVLTMQKCATIFPGLIMGNRLDQAQIVLPFLHV